MKETIGQTAGKIWQTLGQKGDINVAMLPKMVKEKNDVAFQALGWLAHEGKILYKKKDGKSVVSLTPEEQEVFKTVH